MWHGATRHGVFDVTAVCAGFDSLQHCPHTFKIGRLHGCINKLTSLVSTDCGRFCHVFRGGRAAAAVHQPREESLHILVVSTCAWVHDFYIFAHAFQETGNVGVHASRLVVCLVLGARVIEDFGNIIEEKRREQNLVLVIQTPVPRHQNQYTMTNVRYNKAFICKGEGRA